MILLALLSAASCHRSDPDPYLLAPGKSVTYINTRFNNGSFEDWSGSSEPPAPPKHTRITMAKGREPVTVPGWTLTTTSGHCGFDNVGSAPHLRSQFFGLWSCRSHLCSDAYGKGAGFADGTVIEVSYVQLVEYSDKHLEAIKEDKSPPWSTYVHLILNGADETSHEMLWKSNDAVRLGVTPTPAGYVNKDPQYVGTLRHTLTAVQAQKADEHGVRLQIQCVGPGSYYAIDKIAMKVTQPSGG